MSCDSSHLVRFALFAPGDGMSMSMSMSSWYWYSVQHVSFHRTPPKT